MRDLLKEYSTSKRTELDFRKGNPRLPQGSQMKGHSHQGPAVDITLYKPLSMHAPLLSDTSKCQGKSLKLA
jgi:hypothetical protein